MKRTLMWVAFIMVTLFTQAQEIYLGGGISLWHNTDLEKTSFSISPEIGYVFSEKWAVGAEIAYAHNSYEGAFEATSNAFVFAPYARFSFYENKIVRLFLDMGMGVSTMKVKDHDSYNGFEIGLKPGLAIKLNQHFSLVSRIGFAGYRDDYFRGSDGLGVELDGENISLGIEYEF